MVTTVATTNPKLSPETRRPQSGGNGSGRNGYHGSDGSSDPSREASRLGIWLGLAAILMLFMALTSALIVRQGLSDDWRAIRAPGLLWPNTLVLLLSSLTLEVARRSLQRGLVAAFNRWLSATMILGWVFLVGQVMAWQQLAAQGVFLATTPHSSFFYLLTGAHGVHLLGGVVVLMYLTARAWSKAQRAERGGQSVAHQAPDAKLSAPCPLRWVELTAIYWHFMDGLWVYLVVLLFVIG